MLIKKGGIHGTIPRGMSEDIFGSIPEVTVGVIPEKTFLNVFMKKSLCYCCKR